MSAYYLAMPIGSALGISYGLDHRVEAELAPGVLLGRCAGLVAAPWPSPFPSRSGVRARTSIPNGSRRHERAGASREEYVGLMANASFIYSVLGMAAYTFAIGGMLVWVPNYLFSTRGFDQGVRGDDPGAVTLGAARAGHVDRRLDRRPPGQDETPGAIPRPGRGDVRLDPVRADGPFRELRAGDLRRDLRGGGCSCSSTPDLATRSSPTSCNQTSAQRRTPS